MFGINPRPSFCAHSQVPPQPMTSGFHHYALGGARTKVSGGLSRTAPEGHFLAPSLHSTSRFTPSWHPFLPGCHCSILQLSFCYSWILSSALYIQGLPEAQPWGFLFSFFGQCQPFMWLQYWSMKSILIFLSPSLALWKFCTLFLSTFWINLFEGPAIVSHPKQLISCVSSPNTFLALYFFKISVNTFIIYPVSQVRKLIHPLLPIPHFKQVLNFLESVSLLL